MTKKAKDLFRSVFAKYSEFSHLDYRKNFLENLPKFLLNTAVWSAPEIQNCKNFDELKDFLDNPRSGNKLWRNSEIYPYLNYLAFPNNIKNQLCVNSLLVHCNLREMTEETNPDVNFWRFSTQYNHEEAPKVFFFDEKSTIQELNVAWDVKKFNSKITFFKPHLGLFDDIEPRLYKEQFTTFSDQHLHDLISESFVILHKYDKHLCENIFQTLSNIALLKEVGDERPKSFSLRNLYIGTVFISISSPYEIVEQIIHEYYHQCFWPWWLLEAPQDLPETSETIISPISKEARAVPTMIQAALIYASLIDFYRYMTVNFIETVAHHERAVRRLKNIEGNYQALINVLKETLVKREKSTQLVDAIVQSANV